MAGMKEYAGVARAPFLLLPPTLVAAGAAAAAWGPGWGFTGAVAGLSAEGRVGHAVAEGLLGACDVGGRLPPERRIEAQMLIGMLESRLG